MYSRHILTTINTSSLSHSPPLTDIVRYRKCRIPVSFSTAIPLSPGDSPLTPISNIEAFRPLSYYVCRATDASSSSSSCSSLHSEGILHESLSSTSNKGKSAMLDEEKEVEEEQKMTFKSMMKQISEIIFFAGPVLGIWLSGPIMSLIDTAVVGNSSSLELAALGPGTVFCDQVGYIFMFLSVATSNLIASSLAKQDKQEAARHLSALLSVSLACGICMLMITSVFSQRLLEAFIGPENVKLLPAACSYVKIRGLAWPIVLVGLVAQSASLGMQDSWSPLKILGIASFVNAFGDMLFCTYLNFGIAGAAWATMLSQYVAGFLMLRSLNEKGYNPLAFRVPSFKELVFMIKLAGPVLLTMLSKVSFYTFVTYLTTSLGTLALAAHQVMVGLYSAVSVPAESLSQTAQSFMPGLIQKPNPKSKKAQVLLKSLLVIGIFNALILGIVAICVPWIFPQVFTRDMAVIRQMRIIAFPLFCGLLVTHPLLALEGTLLAGRDLQFLSLSMVSCFTSGSIMLVITKMLGYGLQGFWWSMVFFQLIRFLMASLRLTSEKSILNTYG